MNVNVNIYEFINDVLSGKYNLEDLLIDYKDIIENKEILGYHNDKIGDIKTDECNVNNCYLIDRYERSKDYYSQQRTDKLFFIDDNSDDNEANTKLMIIQDILDTILCYFNHSMRINMDTLMKNDVKTNEKDDYVNSNFINELLKDKVAEKLSECVTHMRNNSSRFRESKRNNYQISKFMTANTYKNIGLLSEGTKSNSDEAHSTFIDDL